MVWKRTLVLSLALLLLLVNGAFSHTLDYGNSRSIRIDTLSRSRDSVFAKITMYKNDTLTDYYTGFINRKRITYYPPVFRGSFLNWIRTIRKEWIIECQLHGEVVEYKPSGMKKVELYDHATLKSTNYYAQDGSKITREHYSPTTGLMIGPCGTFTGVYIIYEPRKLRHL